MRTNKPKLTLTQNKQTSSPPSEQENEKDRIRFSTWVRVIPLLAIPRRPVREAPRPQPTSRRRRREWAGRLWYSGTLTKTTPLPSASSSRKISLLSTPGTTTIGPRSTSRPSMAGSTWPNAWSSTALTSTLRIAGKIRYFFLSEDDYSELWFNYPSLDSDHCCWFFTGVLEFLYNAFDFFY